MSLKIKSLGVWASWGLKNRNHFSLLLEWKGKKIWIDPAVDLDEKVDLILLSSPDNDHYRKLDKYLSKYSDTPVFSTTAVLNKIDTKFKDNLYPFSSPIKIDGMKIIVLSIPLMVGEPACAFKFETKSGDIGVVPEFDRLGKQEILYLKNTILIIGIGEYEERKPDDHKATFKELVEDYLPKIKPRQVYLTNFRLNTYKKYKNEMKAELKKWNGNLLTDGEILELSYENTEKWHVPYNPKEYTNEQLADDVRLFVAVYSKMKEGQSIRISEGRDEFFTEDKLFKDFVIPLYKEIANRVKNNKMRYNVDLENASDVYKEFWDKVKEYLTNDEINSLTGNTQKKADIKPGYYSNSKPVYRGYFEELEDNLKSIGWDKKKILVDTKWDGIRMTIGKSEGKGWAFVDPEGLKRKSPNISNRIPAIIKEIEDNFPDNTVLDGEFLAIHPNKKEMLHRTVANSVLNSNMSGEELENYAIIFIFDVLFYDGVDLREMPLHERLEYLSRLKSTKHIWIEKISTKFPDKADGFIVNGNEFSKIKKIADFLRDAKNGRPKYCAEGIMIKTLDGIYEEPENHNWQKIKLWHEIDLRVIDKKKVKGSKNTYNYYLGYDTPKEFAESYLSNTTKDWYGKVYVYDGEKFLCNGKDCKQYLDNPKVKFITLVGKSDNTNIDVKAGDILRIAAEEVLKFDNPNDERYPRYSFYIGRALEPIPEKNVTDSLDVLEKLSSFEPKRIPIDVLRHIKEKEKSKETDSHYTVEKILYILKNEKGEYIITDELRDKLLSFESNDDREIIGIVLKSDEILNDNVKLAGEIVMFVDDVDENKEEMNG